MSRKDFVALTNNLRELYVVYERDPEKALVVEKAARAVASACEEANERFDFNKFLAACGVPS